jgi:hypothetical protein
MQLTAMINATRCVLCITSYTIRNPFLRKYFKSCTQNRYDILYPHAVIYQPLHHLTTVCIHGAPLQYRVQRRQRRRPFQQMHSTTGTCNARRPACLAQVHGGYALHHQWYILGGGRRGRSPYPLNPYLRNRLYVR